MVTLAAVMINLSEDRTLNVSPPSGIGRLAQVLVEDDRSPAKGMEYRIDEVGNDPGYPPEQRPERWVGFFPKGQGFVLLTDDLPVINSFTTSTAGQAFIDSFEGSATPFAAGYLVTGNIYLHPCVMIDGRFDLVSIGAKHGSTLAEILLESSEC